MTGAVFSADPGHTMGAWAVMSIEANPVYRGGDTVKLGSSCAASHVLGGALRFFRPLPPVIAATEGQYLDEGKKKNVGSLIKLSRSAGRWEEAAATCGLIHEYIQPSVWITAELGRGLRRDQIAKLVEQKYTALYGIEGLSEHQYSAIGIGRYVAIREWRKQLQLQQKGKANGRSRNKVQSD